MAADEQTPGRPRRRGGGSYPLWLGIAATAGLTWAWLSQAPGEAAVEAKAADAAVDAAPQRTPAPEPTRLTWRIGPRPPIDAGALDGCLARAGFERALVVAGEPLLVTHPDRVRPIALRASEGPPAVELSTPVEADARLAATLHVAITACLYAEGASVHDPVLDRRLEGRSWPQLGPSGGLPVQHLVEVEARDGAVFTRGLARLDRGELALAVGEGDGAAARRILQAFAAAAIVAPAGASALERAGGHRARAVTPAAARAAGWWTAESPADMRILADDADPLRPVALPAPRVRRPAPKPTPEPAADRRATRPAPKPRPTPKPAPKPAPKPERAPVPFSPAYR